MAGFNGVAFVGQLKSGDFQHFRGAVLVRWVARQDAGPFVHEGLGPFRREAPDDV